MSDDRRYKFVEGPNSIRVLPNQITFSFKEKKTMSKDIQITRLKPSELVSAIEDAIRSDVIPVVLGSPGSGKSDIIRQVTGGSTLLKYFQSLYKGPKPLKKVRLVDERVSTMDLTDWRGVPDIDRERQRTVWYAPDFLPMESDGPTVVFFDEITQCPANTQAPLLQILLDRAMGTVWKAPAHTRFIAAGNLMDDGAYANKLGSALRDRLVALYLEPDVDDWCRWAYANGIEPSVIAFIRFRPELFYKFDKNVWASPTARGWEMVSRIVQNATSRGRSRDALIEGKVGHGVMMEFTAFEPMFNTLPNIDAVLLNPDVATLPPADKPELAYAMANALSRKATVSNLDRVITYLNRMREEYAVFAVKMAVRRDEKLQTVPAFSKWAVMHAESM